MYAKEMFERMGYIYQESYWNETLLEIKYISSKKFGTNVYFNIEYKTFKLTRKYNDKSGWCDSELLQAINKQIEELGWLDVKD